MTSIETVDHLNNLFVSSFPRFRNSLYKEHVLSYLINKEINTSYAGDEGTLIQR